MDKPWKHAKQKKLGIENCMFYSFMGLKASKELHSQEAESTLRVPMGSEIMERLGKCFFWG